MSPIHRENPPPFLFDKKFSSSPPVVQLLHSFGGIAEFHIQTHRQSQLRHHLNGLLGPLGKKAPWKHSAWGQDHGTIDSRHESGTKKRGNSKNDQNKTNKVQSELFRPQGQGWDSE